MEHTMQFYIDGRWVEPTEARPFDVIDPSTEQPIARIALGSAEGRGPRRRAPRAAPSRPSRRRRARSASSCCSSIAAAYQKRYAEMAKTISQEMGAPFWLSQRGAGRHRASAT